MTNLEKWFNRIPKKERGGVMTLLIFCAAVIIFALGIEVGRLLPRQYL